jgi:5-methylcytosine-specific restriction endonuclease McrA
MQKKACKSCGEEKLLAEFHRNKNRRDGLSSDCKVCSIARAASWYSANRERARESRKQYYRNNHQRMRRLQRIYRATNADRLSRVERDWRRRNRDHKRALDRSWAARFPDKVRVFKRVSEHRRRSKKLASAETHNASEINALVSKQCGRCAYCLTSFRIAGYHIDHVVPLKLGGHNGITNIQLLCPPCNTRKSAKDPIKFRQENGFLL